MNRSAQQKVINHYLNTRAELGKVHSNDRVSQEKMWADAKLRGQIGTRAGNEVIAAIDSLRMRGY